MKRVFALLVALVAIAATGPASAAPDRRPPVVRFSTEPGQTFLITTQNPLLEHAVRGRATDDKRGIRRVFVRFKPCDALEGPCAGDGEPQNTINQNVIFGGLETICSAGRRVCTWSIPAPVAPGAYQVSAWATDRAGNRSKTRTLRILVL